ncbi:phage portal protein [Sporosarcina sp. FSL K6-5500]|uniref:phage portal protein n=1 Tax=Sporosarcina sp. FSL K6-5500 TaxID=2921558 RepID=UPI0030F4B4F1
MDPFSKTETEKINKIVETGAKNVVGDEAIILHEVQEWEKSKLRNLMLVGQRYYVNDNDILERKRMVVGEGGQLEEAKNIANKKIVHGFIRKMVDQKVGYLLSLPFTARTDNELYQKALSSYFNKSFYRMFQNVGKEAINKGKAWIHTYYDEQGDFKMKRIPSEEIIPLWKDSDHTELAAVIRSYEIEMWVGKEKATVKKIEVWDLTGVYRYVMEKGKLILDVDEGGYSPHVLVEDGENAERVNWQRIPFVCFKYNDEELPIINFVKSIIDDYDLQKSDNANNIEDLPSGGIYVVKNYDGVDLGEFRRNLSVFRAAKVAGDGGLDYISTKIDTEAFKVHMDMQRKDLYELGRGVDTQSETLGNDKSGIALRFLYADLDMDANIIATEFQASLEQLKWFIDQDIANRGGQDYSDENVDFILNRDIIINESEVIENASKSASQISDETIIANHPWVTDVQEELKRIEKQYGKDDDYKDSFKEVKVNE